MGDHPWPAADLPRADGHQLHGRPAPTFDAACGAPARAPAVEPGCGSAAGAVIIGRLLCREGRRGIVDGRPGTTRSRNLRGCVESGPSCCGRPSALSASAWSPRWSSCSHAAAPPDGSGRGTPRRCPGRAATSVAARGPVPGHGCAQARPWSREWPASRPPSSRPGGGRVPARCAQPSVRRPGGCAGPHGTQPRADGGGCGLGRRCRQGQHVSAFSGAMSRSSLSEATHER
jgi:hypothetical protein